MATLTLLSSGAEDNDLTNVTNWVSPSITWGSAEAGLLCVGNRVGSGTPPTATITGGWSSWNIEADRASGTVASLWVARGTGTKTDESITVDFNDNVSSLGRTYVIAGLSGTVAADPIGLISNSGGTATGATATLAGSPASDSQICCWMTANADTDMAANTGWTEVAEPNATAPALNSVLVSADALDQTYVTSWTTSIGYGWIIFEVLNGAVAPLTPSFIARPQPIVTTW